MGLFFATWLQIGNFAGLFIMETTYRIKNDLISAVAALACAIHCVALPLFFSTIPLFGIEIIENFWLELTTILISAGVGGFAIYKGFLIHKNKWVVLLFLSGIGLMLVGNFFHKESAEYASKIVGALLLLICHLINLKKSHKKSCSNINHIV